MLIKYADDPEDIINLSVENIERLRAQSDRISIEEISDIITVLSKLINDARYASKPRVLLELAIIEMCY